MRTRTGQLLIGAFVIGLTSLAQGQAPATPPAPGQAGGQRGAGPQGPQVVSPQVNADRTVTVRLNAPKATEITVTGELLNGSQPKAMAKNAEGIWEATLGPVPADVYTYAFNIDGVNTPDPRNPWVKLVSAAGLASQVEVPGDGPQYYDSKPVPHGLLQILTYESKATGATRQAYVYTPPDYLRTSTRYPVLYLLHGAGDLDPGWAMTGRAHIIMDNLIAEKKARPMVVVMPLARGGGSLGLGPSGMSPGIQAAGNVVPGAGQNVEVAYPKFFANDSAAAKQMKLIWVAVGSEDFALAGSKALDETLTKNGIKHSFEITPGYRHEWRLWRPHLRDFAQLLFTDAKTPAGTK